MHNLVFMDEYYEQKSISIIDLAKFNQISESYLSKIFGKLSKYEIIKSVPGVKGGYMLNKHPKDINFWDVIVAIEGTENFFNCKEIRQQSSLSCATNKGPDDFKTACLIQPCIARSRKTNANIFSTKNTFMVKGNCLFKYL